MRCYGNEGVPYEKNANLKSMQVIVLKSVIRIRKRGGGIKTD